VGDPDPEITLHDVGASRRTQRDPEDDFFCLRYQVWYPSYDCAFRTKFKTSPGCLDCEQGRFNLKRHSDALGRARFAFISLE
jgi:hypothetical protein